jgi:hypothetical protein
MPKSHSWIRHEQEVRVPLSRQRRPKLRAPSSSFPYRVSPLLTSPLNCRGRSLASTLREVKASQRIWGHARWLT